MGKAKMLGMKTGYTPNAKADKLHRKKTYQRGRETALRNQDTAPGLGAWRCNSREKKETQ